MNSYILIPIMVASIGSGLAKCSVKSTVHGAARKVESAAINKVVVIESASKKILAPAAELDTAVAAADLSKASPAGSEIMPSAQTADRATLVHLPASAAISKNDKYQNALATSRSRFKEKGELGTLGKISDQQASALDWQIQPPPLSGFAVVPTDKLTWSQTFSPLKNKGTSASVASASDKDLKGAIQSARMFENARIDTNIGNLPRTIGEFRSRLANDTSSIFVVIGHNEDGVFVIPPSGRLSLSQMSAACGETNRVCVFLSCESNGRVENGVRREITFGEAQEILSNIQQLSKSAIEQKYSLRDFAGAVPIIIEATEKKQERRNALRVTARLMPAVGLTGGGLAILIKGDKN